MSLLLQNPQILPSPTQIHKAALAELSQKVEKKWSLKKPHILVKAKGKTTGEILGKSLKLCRALSGDLVLGGEMLLRFFVCLEKADALSF